MTVGLRIRNPDGSMLVDEYTSLGTTISVVSVGKTNGSYTLPSDVAGKIAYAVFPNGPTFYAPVITISTDNRTVTWTWQTSGSNANQDFKMFVGAV